MEEQKTGRRFVVFVALFVLCLCISLYVRNWYLKSMHFNFSYTGTDSGPVNVDSDIIYLDSDAIDVDLRNVNADYSAIDVNSGYVDIYWDEFTWQDITICNDKASCITLMDRNLWATTNDITQKGSYWYYFQWWNNYWFNARSLNGEVWQVDTSQYWPNNPYNSDVFLYWYNSRDSVWNDNLRWWSWDSENNHRWRDNRHTTVEDRQWPCPKWYHVPSIWERNELLYYRYSSLGTKYWILAKSYSLYGVTDQEWNIWKMITEYFNIPTAGEIITNRWQPNGTGELIPHLVWLTSAWTIAKVWSSTPYWHYDKWWSHGFIRTFSVSLYEYSDSISVGISGIGSSEWLPVRCFKNFDIND